MAAPYEGATVDIPGHSGGSAPDSHRLPFTTDRMKCRCYPTPVPGGYPTPVLRWRVTGELGSDRSEVGGHIAQSLALALIQRAARNE